MLVTAAETWPKTPTPRSSKSPALVSMPGVGNSGRNSFEAERPESAKNPCTPVTQPQVSSSEVGTGPPISNTERSSTTVAASCAPSWSGWESENPDPTRPV